MKAVLVGGLAVLVAVAAVAVVASRAVADVIDSGSEL